MESEVLEKESEEGLGGMELPLRGNETTLIPLQLTKKYPTGPKDHLVQ